ncbi:MAG: chemotaxis protein CheC [Lachnospiraceae bacterium]|nr:chemotaxis protein CheC [Lachnospiraceae bacterium]MDN4744035.1 chemotaxis protein CheC [Lachnospiraceae bacterium C1.1]
MADFNLDNVDNMYFDVLREIGNIGAGNAATSLAKMLSTKVDMKVPRVELLDFKEVGDAMGGAEQIMAGIYLAVDGDINGSIMFLLEEKSAHVLVSKLMGGMQMEEHEGFNEMETSALKEIGNIITGAYLNSLSELTKLTIVESIPDLTIDMAGAILSVPAVEFGMVGDKLLMIQTSFTDDVDLNGYFILVPDVPSYGKLLKALGVMQ